MSEETKTTALLIGEYETNIDSKGRVGLGRFSQHFDGAVVALRMKDHLVVVSPEQFSRLAEGIHQRTAFDKADSAHRFFDKEMQLFKRHFYANSFEISMDAQGRMTVPKKMREKLALVQDVVWVGCGDWLELWQLSEYEKNCMLWEHGGGPERMADVLAGDEPQPATVADGGDDSC